MLGHRLRAKNCRGADGALFGAAVHDQGVAVDMGGDGDVAVERCALFGAMAVPMPEVEPVTRATGGGFCMRSRS